MPRIRLAPQAVADLDEIKRYISDELFDPQAAGDLLALIFERIRTLATLPQTGARLRTDIPILKHYRFIPCKNYLVFYRIEEKFVSVIRILYARRDYLGLLESDTKSGVTG
ncbi:MAG TPA: type II toxin-antitoxin system RelE/ParE family toxin [Sedimentisphaerales bacterium]|nr:type II toxin-antitoxin system RelE/ParE family toxin [Sedimentisphaerales bacterium]